MRTNRALFCLLAAVVLFALTGCFDVEQHLTVNADGSADISNTITVDSSVLDAAAESGGEDVSSMFDDMTTEAEDTGFKVENVNEDGKQGIRATKHIDDIKDLDFSELGEGTKGEIKVREGFLQTKVTVDLSIPFDASAAGEEFAADPSMAEVIDANFKLTLPGRIQAEGADEVSGRTATWKLSPGESVVVKASSTSYSMLVVGGIGGGVLLLVAIVLLIIVMRSRRRRAATTPVAAVPYSVPPVGFAPSPGPLPERLEPQVEPAPEPTAAPVPGTMPDEQAAPTPEGAPETPAADPEAAPPVAPAPAVKYCPQCGAQGDAEATECGACGAPFA